MNMEYRFIPTKKHTGFQILHFTPFNDVSPVTSLRRSAKIPASPSAITHHRTSMAAHLHILHRLPATCYPKNTANRSPSTTTMKISVAALATLVCANAFTFDPNAVRRASIALDATRQPIMAGNWKMNPATEAEAIALGAGLTKLLGEETCPMDEDNEFCTEG